MTETPKRRGKKKPIAKIEPQLPVPNPKPMHYYKVGEEVSFIWLDEVKKGAIASIHFSEKKMRIRSLDGLIYPIYMDKKDSKFGYIL